MNLRRFALALSLAVVLAPVVATADAPYAPPASDTQAVELFKFGNDKHSNFEKAKVKWGKAEIFVKAPLAKVREAVLDYGNYSTFIGRFQKSKLLKKEGQAADVYFQLAILKGAATIWTLEHFNVPVADGKWEKISATMMKGNVDDMQAVWRYRAVDDKNTIVSLELFAQLKMAVAEKLMIKELEDACGEGVLGVRDRAEKK
jgi:ribosome-associated toxin RatA of RatAB toxin-antitoxin module